MSSLLNNTNKKPSGIKFIIEGDKYPVYIRNHEIFKKISRIKKVFPSLGLPNCKEECTISLNEAKQDANILVGSEVRTCIYNLIAKYRGTTGAETLLYNFYTELGYASSMVFDENNSISIKFFRDVSDGKSNFIAKGESFFKGYAKLVEKAKQLGIEVPAIETFPSFKAFSSSNISGNKYQVVFSSSGEEGAWDIATMSMRGISSCQTWDKPQSHGLIGSISSKYVGVIYITSGKKFSDHGTKMLRRSVVRFVLRKDTNKPALMCDKIYPAHDEAAKKIFVDFLKKKTNLPVIFAGDTGWDYYQVPPDTGHWKMAAFAETQRSYMDHKLPFAVKKDPKVSFNQAELLNWLTSTINVQVDNSLNSKLQKYIVSERKEFSSEFAGGLANLIQSLKSTNPGYNILQMAPFGNSGGIYKFATIPAELGTNPIFGSEKEYKRYCIRKYIQAIPKWKQKCLQIYQQNCFSTVFRHFPLSAPKLINLVSDELKNILIAEYKKLYN